MYGNDPKRNICENMGVRSENNPSGFQKTLGLMMIRIS
jgi:hypothetical protein